MEDTMRKRSLPFGALLSGAALILVATVSPGRSQQPQAPADVKLPQRFKIETYISGLPDARSLRLGDKGTLFVSTRIQDKVYAVIDNGGRREAKVIASDLDRPNGLAFKDGTLYIAEGTKISKLENIEDNLDQPPKPVVIYSDFPDHRAHS